MTYDRKSLKQRAKLGMAQARPKTWVVALVLVLMVALVPTLLCRLIPGGGEVVELMGDMMRRPERAERLMARALGALTAYLTLSAVASIVIALFRMVMEYGYCGYGLQVYRGDKAGVGSLFRGFTRLGTVLGSGIMVGVFEWLWFMLMSLVSLAVGLLLGLLSEYVPAPVTALAFVALVAADVVWALWIVYRYALTPYFVMSRPDLDVFGAIAASKKAMKGNKVRRAVLELSFLGWELLLGLAAFVAGALCGLVATLSALDDLLTVAEMVKRGAGADRLMGAAGELMLPYLVALVLALLLCLPFRLWLMSYENVAYAGFFQEIVGNAPAAAAPVAEAPAMEAPVAASAPLTAGGEPQIPETELPVSGGADVADAPAVESGEKPYDPFGAAPDPASQPPQQEEE